MKALISFVFILSLPVLSQTITLEDFNYRVDDISSHGVTKETLYSEFDTKLITLKNSICSNRAHMWSYDIKRKYDLNEAKIFLFYTSYTSRQEGVSWWYHSTPVVNENGKFWVLDRGFPGRIAEPLSVSEWLKEFNHTSECKNIQAEDKDLLQRMYQREIFPSSTSHGEYVCYYKIVPAGYWVPNQIAQNLLGLDQSGRSVDFNRDEINKTDVYQACLEATTNPLGWAWGNGYKRCNLYMSKKPN